MYPLYIHIPALLLFIALPACLPACLPAFWPASHERVSRRGEELLKRHGSAVDLDDRAVVLPLMQLYQGRAEGRDKGSPVRRVNIA